MNNKTPSVDTKLGKLQARIERDDEYPKIVVGLLIDHVWFDFAYIEVNQTEKEPKLRTHIYNTKDDEPVVSLSISKKEIDEFINDYCQ